MQFSGTEEIAAPRETRVDASPREGAPTESGQPAVGGATTKGLDADADSWNVHSTRCELPGQPASPRRLADGTSTPGATGRRARVLDAIKII